eukprot:scaffold433_cov257-Pinguiococcus_pyrenoidosus.AAC.6
MGGSWNCILAQETRDAGVQHGTAAEVTSSKDPKMGLSERKGESEKPVCARRRHWGGQRFRLPSGAALQISGILGA